MTDEQITCLLHARSELGRTIADPMWADHAEVSKSALKRWHSAIDATIKAVSANVDERGSFESWASRYTRFPENYDNIPAWIAWQARAARGGPK